MNAHGSILKYIVGFYFTVFICQINYYLYYHLYSYTKLIFYIYFFKKIHPEKKSSFSCLNELLQTSSTTIIQCQNANTNIQYQYPVSIVHGRL